MSPSARNFRASLLLGLAAPAGSDPAVALETLERACLLGEADGCLMAARTRQAGSGGADPAVLAAVVKLYERACHAGNGEGCSLLGASYQLGRGVPEDRARAFALYDEACRYGEMGACVELVRNAKPLPLPDRLRPKVLHEACRAGFAEACKDP